MTRSEPLQMRPIRGVAVDQGSGLGEMLRKARGPNAQQDDLLLFKRMVVEQLSADASTVLVDANFGRELLPSIAPNCEKMLAFEADVYRITGEDRMTVLPENLKVADYVGLGVQVLKFFLYFEPNDQGAINERKFDLVRKISAECRQHGIRFLFEPIVFDRRIPDESSAEFAMLKPDLVTEATRLFAAPEFGIDFLKVEHPVNLAHVEGFGTPTMTRAEADAALRRAAEAAGDIPLLYLSAGVTFEQFEGALKMAKASGARFAGFMCGRAIWHDAISIFGKDGPGAAEAWLADEGRSRLARLSETVA